MSSTVTNSLTMAQVKVGQQLPPLECDVSATTVVLGALALSTKDLIPMVGIFPLPTLLFGGGLLAGWLISLLCRVPAAIAARRRARRARKRMRSAVEEVAVDDVVLSGAIDLLFVENGEVVIVDFKTDAAADLAALAEVYRPQMLAYALAVQRVLCTPVREVILFFLAAGREWPIAVTDEALAEVVPQIVTGA